MKSYWLGRGYLWMQLRRPLTLWERLRCWWHGWGYEEREDSQA